MGAWRAGTIDNDSAADFLLELREEPDLTTVLEALNTPGEDGDVDPHEAEEALAAAELVAAALGRPLAANDAWSPGGAEADDVIAIARALPELAGEAELAKRAIAHATHPESELYGLWDESGEVDGWLAAVAELRGRLDGPAVAE